MADEEVAFGPVGRGACGGAGVAEAGVAEAEVTDAEAPDPEVPDVDVAPGAATPLAPGAREAVGAGDGDVVEADADGAEPDDGLADGIGAVSATAFAVRPDDAPFAEFSDRSPVPLDEVDSLVAPGREATLGADPWRNTGSDGLTAHLHDADGFDGTPFGAPVVADHPQSQRA